MLQNERKENEKNTITHSSNTSKLDIAFQITWENEQLK